MFLIRSPIVLIAGVVIYFLVLVVALFVVGWSGAEPAFLLVPVVALIGAVQTAFDSSYLTFARWYAAFLERYLNHLLGARIHVAAELENTYLFELGSPKIVTIPLTGGFTWFSFVTIFYTVIGALAYAFGLVLGWETLTSAPIGVAVLYLAGLFGLTLSALLVPTVATLVIVMLVTVGLYMKLMRRGGGHRDDVSLF